ncbi:MAG: VWA domain-containing protein, partial [Clostridia bacterium]|nr:VWA domain-containing protein [Clostridia bacterium]
YKIIPKTESKIELDLKSNYGEEDGNSNKNYATLITVYDNGEKCGEYFYLLKNGLQTVELMHEFDSLGAHNMKFEISNYEDTSKKNNTYHAFVKFDYLNRILLIEHRSGESQKLQSLLTDSYSYDVTALGIDTDFDSIPKTTKELCAYDQVILVNIANSDLPPEFDGVLYKYVNQFGGGLLTVGGENSDMVDGKIVPHAYNSEDLANTLLGEMLPVQAVDYEPPIAVMIVIDCSGSMSDEKLPQAKIGAKACLDVLKDKDYCGIMSFNTEAGEEINVIPVSQKDRILKAINEVGKGDDSGSGGTIFTTAIDNAGRALAATDVERRHIIIVTDGNPSDNLEDFGQHIDNNLKSGITMSIVGIQTSERDIERMKEVCERSDGVFYHVPKGEFNNLPTIMAKDLEMKVVAGIDYGTEFYPTIENATSTTIFDKELNSETKKMIQIKQEEIPPLTGYYGTRRKANATAYLMGNFVPIYAQWQFGNGKVGSFMCDLDGIWSEKFMNDNIGQVLIYNII